MSKSNHWSCDDQVAKRVAVIIPPLCLHLAEFKSRHSATLFRNLQDCLRLRPLGRAAIERDSNEVVRCGACSHAPPRLYACITCAVVSCHLHAPDHEHAIAVDVDRAELYYCLCGDQVYDQDFNAAVMVSQSVAANLGGRRSLHLLPSENLRKRRHVSLN